jgi:sugar (pentulose or hexulose) kinase
MIAIFDIGKTNKKCFVFDEAYRIVYEKSEQLSETTDEDGYPCENLPLLIQWVEQTLIELLQNNCLQIKAINASAYGASWVHLDEAGQTVGGLLNYLKPYGELPNFPSLETASPVMGNLNSGLQLYQLKKYNQLVFNTIKYSLHLPQFIAWLILNTIMGRKKPALELCTSEITSIGCHTMLWDFQKNEYHAWVKRDGLDAKFPRIFPTDFYWKSVYANAAIEVGIGIHDSSAALVPYLQSIQEPFLLISTGTWCISLNPFNQEPLTADELANDCLQYLSYKGVPVKAARYFGGHEHGEVIAKLADKYRVPQEYFMQDLREATSSAALEYRDLMRELVGKQVISVKWALGKSNVRKIFVDGGFSKNAVYLQLLAESFPEMEIFSAEMAQATALGAALVLHSAWNNQPLPQDLLSFQRFQ